MHPLASCRHPLLPVTNLQTPPPAAPISCSTDVTDAQAPQSFSRHERAFLLTAAGTAVAATGMAVFSDPRLHRDRAAMRDFAIFLGASGTVLTVTGQASSRAPAALKGLVLTSFCWVLAGICVQLPPSADGPAAAQEAQQALYRVAGVTGAGSLLSCALALQQNYDLPGSGWPLLQTSCEVLALGAALIFGYAAASPAPLPYVGTVSAAVMGLGFGASALTRHWPQPAAT